MTAEARKAQNEVWFRDVNERLETRAIERGEDEPTFEIVCECTREECTERIRVAFGTYEHVRENATYFILAPRHHEPAIERVLAEHSGYEIVEKIGVSAAVADAEDPRS